MRILIFSDIHGNAVGLDAMLADIEGETFDQMVCLGDAIQGGPQPAEVVARLQRELSLAIRLPDVQARLKGLGGEPATISPEQFAALNRQEYERFGALIRQANIKLE